MVHFEFLIFVAVMMAFALLITRLCKINAPFQCSIMQKLLMWFIGRLCICLRNLTKFVLITTKP